MDLVALLSTAVSAAQAAGAAIMDCHAAACEPWYKSPDQPVTAADLASDRLLRERLTALTPGCGWLSEETVDTPERLGKPCTWVVDPLDGTQEFIAGLDEFAVSVAFIDDGIPLLGVVHNPATGETFAGIVGQGVTHNGEAAGPLSACKESNRAQVWVSGTETRQGMWATYQDVLRLHPLGSAAYKLARVAAGFGDAYVSLRPKSEWDICGGTALVLAAGGRVTDLNGHDLRFNQAQVEVNGVVAANPTLHRELMRVVGRSGA
jgi:myo-inositol-1(or 4)-monophosphatase